MQFDIDFLMKLIFNIYKTPLHIAIDAGNTEIVKLLISCKRVDVNLYSI